MKKSEKKVHSEEYLGEARDYWWNEDYLQLLSERLHFKNCNTLIDVGCGIGYMGFKLSPYLKTQAKVLGFDMEMQHITSAKAKAFTFNNTNNTNFHFEVGDANHIPLKDSTADITLCQTLLIHVSEPLNVINEMKRVTKKDGLVVAFEPNNIISSLMQDNITDESIEVTLENVEVEMRIEKGKMLLKEGYNSIGEYVPKLFKDAGLKDIQVWIADKALSLIPPYDTKEKILRAKEILQWIEEGQNTYDYEQQLKYYLSGGGDKESFDNYWNRICSDLIKLKTSIENQTYISPGGSLMYIVSGRK